jgi:hypothetical protein
MADGTIAGGGFAAGAGARWRWLIGHGGARPSRAHGRRSDVPRRGNGTQANWTAAQDANGVWNLYDKASGRQIGGPNDVPPWIKDPDYFTVGPGANYATGTDQIVSRPTMVQVGENGPERLRVEPMSGVMDGGSRGGVTVNVSGISMMDLYSSRRLARELKRMVR